MYHWTCAPMGLGYKVMLEANSYVINYMIRRDLASWQQLKRRQCFKKGQNAKNKRIEVLQNS